LKVSKDLSHTKNIDMPLVYVFIRLRAGWLLMANSEKEQIFQCMKLVWQALWCSLAVNVLKNVTIFRSD